MASIRKIQNKKGISYKIEVSLGYDSNGKKVRETATFVPDPNMTKKQQEKALQKFAYEFEAKAKGGGSAVKGDKTTLEGFIREEWLDHAKATLEETTYCRYVRIINSIIIPQIGHMKLTQISPLHVERLLMGLSKDGARADGKPGKYATESVRKIKNVLSAVLSTAEQWELVPRNPVHKASMPKGDPTDVSETKVYTPEQTRRLLAFIDGEYAQLTAKRRDGVLTIEGYTSGDIFAKAQERALIYTAIFAGMRRGELVAMEWGKSVDFENKTISVKQAAAYASGQLKIKVPKTKNSVRKVSMPEPVMGILREYQKVQSRYRKAIGDQWKGGDWVFTKGDGSIMCITTPYNKFQSILKRYNKGVMEDMRLPLLPLHALRHTHATTLANSNKVPIKTISQNLGHADTKITMAYYVHSYDESEPMVADVLEEILLKKSDPDKGGDMKKAANSR